MTTKAGFFWAFLLVAVATLLFPYVRAQSAQIQQARGQFEAQDSDQKPQSMGEDNRFPASDLPAWSKEKQRQRLLKANLAKSKTDSAELAALAQQLREELETPKVSPLSPACAIRLEKIEKLAKKIRGELTVY